jgi:hypothetical protein
MNEKESIARVVMFTSRAKDNGDIPNFRKRGRTFLSNEPIDNLIPQFKEFVREGGPNEMCRLYVSINPRDVKKTMKKLCVHLIEGEETLSTLTSLPQKVVSIAMKPECAAAKSWLFDFDSRDDKLVDEFVTDMMDEEGFDSVRMYRTPNGYGVIVPNGFDTRYLMNKWSYCCDLKRDAMRFVMIGLKDKEGNVCVSPQSGMVEIKR